MIMKFCPNYHCVAYGHVVYTQTTRCVFCRWDLKPPRMKSETAADQQGSPEALDRSAAMDPGQTLGFHTKPRYGT